MAAVQTRSVAVPAAFNVGRLRVGVVVMPILIVGLGFYVVYPLVLILVNSFNVASIAEPARYGLDNWVAAFSQPRLLQSLGNTVIVYFLYETIGFPIAVIIAWALARIRMPFAHGLEFLFWVSFMLPSLFTTIGWMMLLDPDLGLLNVGDPPAAAHCRHWPAQHLQRARHRLGAPDEHRHFGQGDAPHGIPQHGRLL